MDVQRKGVIAKKRIKLAVILTVITAAVAYAGYRVSQLKPAAPSVERATVWIDTVRRGPMLREEGGLGTLIPEEIVWIPAKSAGQISKVLVKSGERVSASTPIMILDNPDMELAATDLEWQIRQAEANLAELRVRLTTSRLQQQSSLATTSSALNQAALSKDRDEQLTKLGLKSELETRISVARWEELQQRYELEKQQLEMQGESVQAQLDSAQVQVEKLKAQLALKRTQVGDLTIRAGIDGVIQELTLQVGQQVASGTVLAKVAQPSRLMARLQIAETRAKDILVGQVATIDTRNGTIPARVIRIDPNVVNGTRTIDCRLEGALPPGAVPDLSVDGKIEIERLTDVLYIGRPVFGQPNSQVGLFRLDAGGIEALRVPVQLGRGSVSTIEVVQGLQEGDQVILSDMSAQEQNDRIRLN